MIMHTYNSTIKYDNLNLLLRNDEILYQVTSFENKKNNKQMKFQLQIFIFYMKKN